MCATDFLQSRFEEQGLLQRDTRGFEPHLTIMKLSRASKLRSQVRVFTMHYLNVAIVRTVVRERERKCCQVCKEIKKRDGMKM